VNIHLAVVHGIFAQLTLCLAGLLVVVTGAWWASAGARMIDHDGSGRQLLTAAAILTLVVFAQLVIAAMMRHYKAGLAVPDFPLSYGQLIPPVSADGLERANDARVFELALPRTTLGQIWLHTAHRVGAVFVCLAAGWVFWRTLRMPRGRRPGGLVGLIAGLLVLQICLGVATVWMAKPADVATSHVAVGALLLLLSWILTIRVARRYVPAPVDSNPLAAEPATRQTAAQTLSAVPLSA
jgi:cytochrome c oxidase assembly protein subunit 15